MFTEVAQEVLEYLGVPHDTALTAPADLARAKPAPELEEAAPDHSENLDALFAEVNDLPADDPLRNSNAGQQPVPVAANEIASGEPIDNAPPASNKPSPIHNGSARFGNEPVMPNTTVANTLPKPASQTSAPQASANQTSDQVSSAETPQPAQAPRSLRRGVVVSAGNQVDVPSFVGKPLRVAVETAGSLGLAIQIVGSGIAREQAPAPGSMVPPGTEVVVRFSR